MRATNLKLLASEEIKNISFEDVFLSTQYAYDLQQLSNTAVKRTGCNKMPLVRVINNPNDGVAYTDGNKVVVNFGSRFAERLKTNFSVYHTFVVGLIAHELGHVFYTDFDDGIRYSKAIKNGEFYPEKPVHPNANKYENALKDERNRKLIQTVAHNIDNILEDIYVNRRQCANLKGLYAQGIALGNRLVADEAKTVQEQKDNGNSNFTIILNLFLSRIKSGVAFYGKYEAEYKDKVDALMDIAVDYIFDNNHQSRCRGVNLIICELWDELSEMLEKAKDNSDDNMADDSNSDSSDDDSGDNSENSDDSDTENGNGTDGNGKNSEQTDSADLSDEDSGEGTEQSKDFDVNAALDRLKKILDNIEGQTSETANCNTSKTAKEPFDAESLKNSAQNERIPDIKGETTSVESQELSEEGLEAIRAIRAIKQKIANERAEEEIEREIDRELNEITPKDLPLIHKNVRYYVSRPDIKPSDKNVYDDTVSEYKDVINSLVKAIKRIYKAENLSGERKGRYYGKALDTSKLYRPDLKIFKDSKQPKKEISLAVSVLIDESGSMAGQRCFSARNTAIILSEMCEQLNIPFEVFGHTAICGSVHLNCYKNFDAPKKSDKYRLAQVTATFANRDGAAILYATDRLKLRNEKNKLFIIISDGQPADSGYIGQEAKADLKCIYNKLVSDGIDVVAAAIGADKEVIHQIYGRAFLDVSNLSIMPVTFAKLLKSKLL